MEESQFDVIVVGGGLSGLSCARKLHAEGKKVLLLESRDRLGGRTHTIEHDGEKFDVGGQWVGPTQDRVLDLAKELGVQTIDQYYKGKNVIIDESRTEYSGTIPMYSSYIPFVPSVSSLLDLDRTMKSLDKLSLELNPEKPWEHKRAEDWDSLTLEDWMRKNMWTGHAKAALSAANGTVMSCDPCEVSFLYFLFYLRTAGGSMLRLVDTHGGAQEKRFIGGSQQLSNKLAEKLPEGSIIMESPVRSITQNESGVTVVSDKGTFKAKYTVLAVPPALHNKIAFSPALPPKRQALIDRMPMGSVIKVLVFYKTAWWREKGYSGSLVCTTKKMKHPIIATFDDSDDELKHPCIVGFIVGSLARKYCDKTKEERQEAVCKQYAKQWKNDAALTPSHYEDKVWLSEEWSRGCYVGVMPPGVLSTVGTALREPIGRVHFAGTETALIWCGYMDGAIEAGERVAGNVNKLLNGSQDDGKTEVSDL